MNNYNWIISSRDDIKKNVIDQSLFSFKFELDFESNFPQHLFLKLENSNIYFHGIFIFRNKLKILDSTYTGYIISTKDEKNYKKNYKIINLALKKKLKFMKFDLLIIKPSPLLIFNNYQYLTQTMQFNGHIEINGYLAISADQFVIESYNLRREIKIGKNNIKNFNLIDERHKNFKEIFFSLNNYKLKQQVTNEILNNFYINIKKGIYKIKIVLDNKNIVCLIIFSKFGKMATQTYNYNNSKYKNLFINKYLHYEMINDLFNTEGVKTFVFGDVVDSDKKLKKLTDFKQRFSSAQIFSVSISVPISLIGLLFLNIRKLKNLYFRI